MIQSTSMVSAGGKKLKLPLRDWLLMPLVSLLTLVFLAASSEVIARRIFPDEKLTGPTCMISNDPATGVRGVPNAVCINHWFESGETEYRYNSCGHRAGMECGPKPTGTFRIVMAGTSFAFGSYVARDKTFAALMPAELSQRTGRKVEVYNESLMLETPRVVALRFNDLLTPKPDMILWVLTTWDIENVTMLLPTKSIPKPQSLFKRISSAVQESRAANALIYLFYQSPNSYLKRHLMGIGNPGYLSKQLDPVWQRHLNDFDRYFAIVEQKSVAAGVPLVVVMLPSSTQATMISMGAWPAEFDPFKLSDATRAIVESHGAIYVDILPDIRLVPDAAKYFYPISRHPNVDGHRVFSELIDQELTKGTVPGLDFAGQSRPGASIQNQ
jgi:hypothetical protein